MKKIYYSLLCILSLLLSSCNDTAETIRLMLTDPDMKITKISSTRLYAGEQFSITGQDFANSTDFMQVYVGDKACTVLACSETDITAVLPKDAADGTLTLQILDTKLETDSAITVIKPELSTKADNVYPGNELQITGKGLPEKSDSLHVTLGGIGAEITDYASSNETDHVLTITVPQDLNEGTVDLGVSLYGVELFKKTLTILPAPKVESVDASWAQVGKTLQISGSGFSDFSGNVKVAFPLSGTDTKEVDATVVNDTQLEVVVPEGYSGGELAVSFGHIPALKIGTPRFFQQGDVTASVLKNSVSPFTKGAESGIKNCFEPEGWTCEQYTEHKDFILDNGTTNCIIFQTGWDNKDNKTNAKMYQSVTVPAGTYKFTLDVLECGSSKGRFGVCFMITKGKGTLPDLMDGKTAGWIPVDDSNVIENYRITDNKSAHTKDITVTLTEATEISVGFVAQITGQGWVKVNSIKVTME